MTTADSLEAAALDAQRAGRHQECVALLREAITLDPRSAERWNSLGNALVRLGASADARDAYRQALTVDPDFHKPLANLGRISLALGELEDARRFLALAVERNPEAFRARVTYATALARLGARDDAREQLRLAVAAAPDFAPAWLGLADLARTPGEACEALSRAWAIERGEALGARLADALLAAGRPAQALSVAREALAIDPDSAGALPVRDRSLAALAASDPPPRGDGPEGAMTAAAILLLRRDPAARLALRSIRLPAGSGLAHELGERLAMADAHADAVGPLRDAVATHPRSYRNRTRLAQSLVSLRREEEAVQVLEPVGDRWRTDLTVGLTAAEALAGADRLVEAITLLEALRARFPGARMALDRAVTPLLKLGRVEEALGLIERREQVDSRAVAETSGLLNYHYLTLAGPADLAERHARWASRLPSVVASPVARAPVEGRRLRVAYLSGDLRAHPVAKFLLPLLRAHDRARFEVHALSSAPDEDEVTAEIARRCDGFHRVADRSAEEVAERCRALGIDIAVDLSGHTGGSLMTALRHGAAPTQATWLGYPNTTGLPEVHWRITDAEADPPGSADALHAEALLRLPEGCWCYSPTEDHPLGVGPVTRTGVITFGSFNRYEKLSAHALDLWSAVLRQVPRSRLALKFDALRDPATHAALLARLEGHGIGADRLLLLPRLANPLASFEQVDITLDAFPYHGTTTTCESLWMGVPAVTRAGDAHVSRVGVSLLRRVGLDDLIARDDRSYIEAAARLARDLPRLASLRQTLRGAMRATALGDPVRFARQFESALRDAHVRALAGPLPRGGLRALAGAERVIALAPGVRVPFARRDERDADEAWITGAACTAGESWIASLAPEAAAVFGVGDDGAARVARLYLAGARVPLQLLASDPHHATLLEAAQAAPALPWARVARLEGDPSRLRILVGRGAPERAASVADAGPTAFLLPRDTSAPQGFYDVVAPAGTGLLLAPEALPGCAPTLWVNAAARGLLTASGALVTPSGPIPRDLAGACEALPSLGSAGAVTREAGAAAAEMLGAWWASRDARRAPSSRAAAAIEAVRVAASLHAPGDGTCSAKGMIARVLLDAGHTSARDALDAFARALRAGEGCPTWLPLDDEVDAPDAGREAARAALASALRASYTLARDHDDAWRLTREHASLGVASTRMERALLVTSRRGLQPVAAKVT